ncbi:trichohyalin-like [Paramacrobiotus metropolitanus]|uniref:trichohyalin-like n=1 Tax=Paramacrobiotus metropolitanus TaxID=2943436 RepID=UPI002445D9CD|nr:trichohyalin-like [Paramacrobiotus metropolitanus]
MAERSQSNQNAAKKGQRPAVKKVTGDPLTNYNEDCPDCKRNNILSNERFPCWTCVVAVPNQAVVVPEEARRGNLDVFRHLVTGDTWMKLSPEDRMILEDKYRMWVGRRPGWDITLEPPKTPEADAFRKKFEEDTMRMVQEKREAERKRLEEKEKAAAEKGLAEAAKGHTPAPFAILKKQDEGEAAVIRQSLIQQIDIILQDPLAVSKEEYKIFLDEKVNLTKGNRPSQVIKIAIEERIDRMRNFRKREKDVVEALRNFKKEEFKRPKSPQRDDHNRGYERSSDRSRERSWDRHYNDRYSGYARDTRTSEQKRRDEERIRREKEQREKRRQEEAEEKRLAEEYRKINETCNRQQEKERAAKETQNRDSQNREGRSEGSSKSTSSKGPYDQEWAQDNLNMDDYEFGDKSYNSKRSSSSESHRTPKSPRRMQSVVHSVCSTFKSAEKQPAQQMDEVMECSPASSNVIEVHGDEDMRPSRRNIIFDLEHQLTSAETASNAPPESDSEKGDQKGQSKVTAPRRHSLLTIELVYEMNDIMEQTNEICRSVGIAPDSKDEFDKVYWLLMNLRQVINDSGYAKEYEYGQWEDLIITQESANLHYFPTRECGLVSLIDLSLLETPLDTPDPTGMTQFQYRDIKERRLHVAQFVLRHVNPALRLLAGRAALGLVVKPDSPPDHRATIQKIFAARLGHYESHHQLRKSAQRDDEGKWKSLFDSKGKGLYFPENFQFNPTAEEHIKYYSGDPPAQAEAMETQEEIDRGSPCRRIEYESRRKRILRIEVVDPQTGQMVSNAGFTPEEEEEETSKLMQEVEQVLQVLPQEEEREEFEAITEVLVNVMMPRARQDGAYMRLTHIDPFHGEVYKQLYTSRGETLTKLSGAKKVKKPAEKGQPEPVKAEEKGHQEKEETKGQETKERPQEQEVKKEEHLTPVKKDEEGKKEDQKKKRKPVKVTAREGGAGETFVRQPKLLGVMEKKREKPESDSEPEQLAINAKAGSSQAETDEEKDRGQSRKVMEEAMTMQPIYASTMKERKDKADKEKKKRDTSVESAKSEVSVASSKSSIKEKDTRKKGQRDTRKSDPSLADYMDAQKKPKVTARNTLIGRVDAADIVNWRPVEGDSELDYTDDEYDDRFFVCESNEQTTIEEIDEILIGATADWGKATRSVTSKFRKDVKAYCEETNKRLPQSKYNAVLEYARSTGKVLQKHPKYGSKAKLYITGNNNERKLATANADIRERIERAIIGMCSPMGTTKHRMAQFINGVWSKEKGNASIIERSLGKVLTQMVAEKKLHTTNPHKGVTIRYSSLNAVPEELRQYKKEETSEDTTIILDPRLDAACPILSQIKLDSEKAATSSKKGKEEQIEESMVIEENVVEQQEAETVEKGKPKLHAPKSAEEAIALVGPPKPMSVPEALAAVRSQKASGGPSSMEKVKGHQTLAQSGAAEKGHPSSSQEKTVQSPPPPKEEKEKPFELLEEEIIDGKPAYMTVDDLNENNVPWMTIFAAIGAAPSREMDKTDIAKANIGGTNGFTQEDVSNYMAVQYDSGQENMNGDRFKIQNALDSLVKDGTIRTWKKNGIDRYDWIAKA